MLLRHNFILALILNLFFLALYFAFGIVRHGSLDDYFMSNVLTGAYGSNYDVHTYFVNSAYGYFLKPFYLLFPKVGWYFIFELVGTFAAFIVFTYALITKLGKKWGVALSLLLLGSLTPDFYFQLSFTQCATAYTAAGIVLFSLGCSYKKRAMLVLAGLFLVAGSTMRWEGFLLGMPLLGVLFLVNIFDHRKINNISVVVLVAVFVAVFAVKTYDRSLYSQGDYKYYAEYQPVRAFFGDGAYYDSESTFDELEEREMSGMDFRFVKGWIFYDTEILSADSLRTMAGVAKRNMFSPNWSRMPVAFIMAVSTALTRTNGWCWALFCLLLMFIPNRKANLYPWISLLMIAASIGYLLLVNRLAYHVETGIWLCAVVGTIPFFEKEKTLDISFVEKRQNFIVFSATLIAILFTCLSISSQPLKQKWNIIETKELTQEWKEFVDYSQKHLDDVFLLSFEHYKQLGTLKGKPYKAVEPGSWQNIFPLGYWNINLPAMKSELTKRGVLNPIKDIVKSNVYVVEDVSNPVFTEYYLRHYHRTLTIDTVANFGKKNLLKYRFEGEE